MFCIQTKNCGFFIHFSLVPFDVMAKLVIFGSQYALKNISLTYLISEQGPSIFDSMCLSKALPIQLYSESLGSCIVVVFVVLRLQ